ncbi:hypothetical protein LGM58_41845 [Burkholderia contaminans]|uniref:hypothetical protein n=1 Tax=Burkholderia contaminans TaxID=488447 RepID=UPI001CF3AA5F|nr:hypothetical protein [Burkholderia contaminans]MCA7889724.1 hypothetical protein [Burkholderia contaminans]
MLDDVIADAVLFIDHKSLCTALSSQGALARFSEPERHIFTVSLNTLKRRSDTVLSGGFASLDKKRRIAREALEVEVARIARAKKRTRGALLIELSEVRQTLSETREELVKLTAALYDAMRYGRICADASKNSAASLQYEKHMSELLKRFSLATKMNGDAS